MPEPFVLLDDARPEPATPARLYRAPEEIVIARRPEEVEPALVRLAELARNGRHLAGHIAYEAGLALEPRLAALAPARTGASGPLLWFGVFASYTEIAAEAVPAWLTAEAGGPCSVGPLDPALSAADYGRAFAALQESHDCIYCVVDLHAITVAQDPAELTANIREVTAAFIACGIDPKQHIVFN